MADVSSGNNRVPFENVYDLLYIKLIKNNLKLIGKPFIIIIASIPTSFDAWSWKSNNCFIQFYKVAIIMIFPDNVVQ